LKSIYYGNHYAGASTHDPLNLNKPIAYQLTTVIEHQYDAIKSVINSPLKVGQDSGDSLTLFAH
jgi:hypothetical protein